MKKLTLLTVILALVQMSAHAQDKKPEAPKGYWVVQDNVRSPRQATILYYNNDHQVVHQEDVAGKRVRAWKPRISKRLNATLQVSLDRWAARQKNEALIAQKQ